MASGRAYAATTNLVAYTGTSATPILYGTTPATATIVFHASAPLTRWSAAAGRFPWLATAPDLSRA